MANIKIAQLTNKTVLADTDILIVESATATEKMTIAKFVELLGIDKGKIIDSGASASARYVKFEDGTLINYGRIETSLIDIPIGSGYRTATVTRQLAHPLSTTDYASIQVTAANFAFGTGTIMSTTEIITALMSFDSGRTASGYWYVVGRWK